MLAALIGGAIYNFQRSLMYFPAMQDSGRSYVCTPERFNFSYEDVYLKTSDGVTIHSWLIKQERSRFVPTFVFFHGNAGNISHRLPNAAELYRKLGVNILLVEYRGFGESGGDISEKGLILDGIAAIDWCLSDVAASLINPEQIIVFGRSLGGAVAIAACKERASQVQGMVLENTFTSMSEMASVVLPIVGPFRWLIADKWISTSRLADVTCPVLLIVGMKDELVPPSMTQQLKTIASAASSAVEMLPIPDGGHNDSWMMPGYYEGLQRWLRTVQLRGTLPSAYT